MNPSFNPYIGEIRVKAGELGARGPLATRRITLQLELHLVSGGMDFET